MEHLLARLASDSPSVSKRVVNLLFKSFFPVNESEKEWCSRCITLIQMNPMAARKFYQYAHQHTAPTNIIKLMLAIRRILNSFIQMDCDVTALHDSNKENSLSVVASLLEILVILWKSVQKAVQQNEEAQKYMFAKFGNVMARYFQSFEDERATVPLVHLASFMPPAAIPTFSCGVLSRLRRMDSGAVPTQYGQLLDCLCSWGQVADVLELITDWLSQPLNSQGKAAGRKVRIQETVEAKPDLALVYLEYLFSHTVTREKLLALSRTPLKQLHTVLGNWKVTEHRPTALNQISAILISTSTRTRKMESFICSLQSSEGRDYLLSLEHAAAWVLLSLFSLFIYLYIHIFCYCDQSFLTVCRDIVLVGLGDDSFKGHILHLCSLALLSGESYLCVPAVLQILKAVANSCVPEESSQDQEDPAMAILAVVANVFQKIIELLARRLKKEPEEGKQVHDVCNLQLLLNDSYRHFTRHYSNQNRFTDDLSAVVLSKATHREEVSAPESAEDMPPLSSILLSVILKSASITRCHASRPSCCGLMRRRVSVICFFQVVSGRSLLVFGV
uniref:Uncharacterized protein n=1 Tax=Salarias fasciatus TaxID=181472 RepID=A0A672J4U8_SALFA